MLLMWSTLIQSGNQDTMDVSCTGTWKFSIRHGCGSVNIRISPSLEQTYLGLFLCVLKKSGELGMNSGLLFGFLATNS